jgi:glycosyltransferase involved in cell wall biosynthesis
MTRGAVRRVLYVQHANALGGSCVSLRYLVESLDRTRFEPVIALIHPSPALEEFYAHSNVEVLRWPGILTFEHTEALWTDPLRPSTWPNLAATLLRWRRSVRRTLELVRHVRPDVVHLNSVVLLPSARALQHAHVPFVWHVREGPTRGVLGLRTALQRRALLSWGSELIFLSESERSGWVQGRRGRVIRNVVDLDRFDPRLDGGPVRAALGIPPEARVVTYLGGLVEMKGALVMLEGMRRLRERVGGAVCLMPGTTGADGSVALHGTSRFRRAVARELALLGSACRPLGFTSDVERLLAATDVVAFPALSNHFARPIVEAGAMERPVVASRHPITEEQVRGNGLLVPRGDPQALADALERVLLEPALAREMGQAGRALAGELHERRANTEQIMEVYTRVLREPRCAG